MTLWFGFLCLTQEILLYLQNLKDIFPYLLLKKVQVFAPHNQSRWNYFYVKQWDLGLFYSLWITSNLSSVTEYFIFCSLIGIKFPFIHGSLTGFNYHVSVAVFLYLHQQGTLMCHCSFRDIIVQGWGQGLRSHAVWV